MEGLIVPCLGKRIRMLIPRRGHHFVFANSFFSGRHPKSSPSGGFGALRPSKNFSIAQKYLHNRSKQRDVSPSTIRQTPQFFNQKITPTKKTPHVFFEIKKTPPTNQLSPISIRIKSTSRWWHFHPEILGTI